MKNKNIVLLIIFAISLIILAYSFRNTLGQQTDSLELEEVTVIYKLDTSTFVEMTTKIVDKDMGSGRAWITDIDEVQGSFVAPDDKAFIGWQYESSIINGEEVSETSSYKSGEHFTQDEYYSLSPNEQTINLVAVWGYKVYVDGINGIDDANGLSDATPVRTMGRAYEVLAQLDSGNSNGNITGFKVSGNSSTGYTYESSDEENLITNFNGKIIVINDISYSNKTEGRYEYITYGDLIGAENASTGTITFNDGVSSKTITNVNNITGYTDDAPVKFKGSGTSYTAQNKTVSGSYHYLLKKVVNDYTYEVDGVQYYTYGRLTQYTENLRAHVGKGVMTPKNIGLVLISGKDEKTYDSTFEFAEYTRYASGGDIIFKDISLSFYYNSSEDSESITYVGGYAANGNYLAIDENVNVITDSLHKTVNIYGGGHSYRYQSNNYTGTGGNGLGNSGTSTLDSTRMTIKSGTWSTAYSGSYGQKVGIAGDTVEKNATVLNIYGGTFSSTGMGHEGAAAVNSYLYAYGGTFSTIYGSGSGSTGSMADNGVTHILLSGSGVKTSKLYGGSNNGSHVGNIEIVINSGTISNTLYGGNNSTKVTGSIGIKINGGTINSIIGGCATGSVSGEVSIDITGGIINGTIYTSGQGGTAKTTTTYYQGTSSDKDLTAQILDSSDSRLNLLITGDSSIDSPAIQAAAAKVNSSEVQYYNDKQDSNGYYYPQIYSSDFSKLLIGNSRGTYKNHGVTQYTLSSYTSMLSLATVAGVNLNITGGVINGDIYGGGKVSVVEGDVSINISNATINGNVYGGGDGTVEPTVSLYFPTSASTYKTETYTWKGSDTFDIANYDAVNNVPIDYENKYVYSPSYDNMGGVTGKVDINITGDSTITGNVYGGGNAGEVSSSKITIDNSNISKNLYGGGYSGKVANSTNITLTNAQIQEVFGGGYSGNIEQNTTVTINSGTYENVFAGCDQAVVKGDTITIVGNETNPSITISSVLYGGGRGVENEDGDASSFCTVEGTATVTIEGLNTNVTNYGSIKLGSVAGAVDVTFKNYWTGNATNKYKVMNGIDRATNVYMVQSYTWLENEGEDGTRQGIQNIGNLNIPEGSGMKISADGEISGDFNGGGELYLDSEVCLTVNGNITGQTKLILNPKLYEEGNIIKGSEDKPYIVTIQGGAEDAVISGDERYTIVSSAEGESGRKYYIENDVSIDETKQTVIVKESERYQDEVDNWLSEDTNTWQDINIEQDGIFSANVDIYYEYKITEDTQEKYKNLERSIIIKSGDTQVDFPVGTKIIMVTNGEYYSLKLESASNNIPLSSFTNMEDKEVFEQITDITKVSEGDEVIKLYHYSEEYRFIIDFSNARGNLFEKGKTYNLLLEVTDNGNKVNELATIAENTIIMNEKRQIEAKLSSDKYVYLPDANISINGSITLSKVKENVYNHHIGKPLKTKIVLNGPNGTNIIINNQEVKENEAIVILETIEKSYTEIPLDIEIQMEKVLKKNRLVEGEYTIQIQILIDGQTQKTVEIPIEIKDYSDAEYGLTVKLSKEDTQKDKIALITKEDYTRNIKINYDGTLQEPYIKIQLYKKAGTFTYTQIENTITQEVLQNVQTENTTTFDASKIQEEGTYRILVELYDQSGNKITEDTINFIYSN